MCPLKNAQESDTLRTELSEKVEQLKADLVIYKSLMTDVSMFLLNKHFYNFPWICCGAYGFLKILLSKNIENS